MNATVKLVLIISVKHAVNSLLVNSAFLALFPATFQIHTRAGWMNLLMSALTIIGARELMVWLPKLIKWSSTGTELPEAKP
jgi:hypothetical protein